MADSIAAVTPELDTTEKLANNIGAIANQNTFDLVECFLNDGDEEGMRELQNRLIEFLIAQGLDEDMIEYKYKELVPEKYQRN